MGSRWRPPTAWPSLTLQPCHPVSTVSVQQHHPAHSLPPLGALLGPGRSQRGWNTGPTEPCFRLWNGARLREGNGRATLSDRVQNCHLAELPGLPGTCLSRSRSRGQQIPREQKQFLTALEADSRSVCWPPCAPSCWRPQATERNGQQRIWNKQLHDAGLPCKTPVTGPAHTTTGPAHTPTQLLAAAPPTRPQAPPPRPQAPPTRRPRC